MIKLIALDLDGTLLTSDKTISDENKQAIKEAVAKGIHVVLCTGRPIMGIRGFLEELDLVSPHHYAVTFNGGLVQVTETEEILAEKTHTLSDVQRIYDEFSRVGLPINPIDLQKVYEPTYPSDNPSHYPIIIKNLQFEARELDTFLPSHTFNKVVSCCPEEVLDARIEKLSEAFKETVTLLKSRPILMEILPSGVDKSFGLKRLCNHLGIEPSEVMTMGDEENDLAMLQWAGYGVAMENATSEVKAVAKYRTGTNDEHGVAQAIKKYALGE